MSIPETQDDSLQIKGILMPAKTFRSCIFILDELLSCYDCFQFLAPVPLTAIVYHTEIKTPMDFKTLENNLYQNKYKTYEAFVQDLCLIWENAKLFHRSFDSIYQQANNLYKRYNALSDFIQGGPRPFYLSTSNADIDLILTTTLPEERMPSLDPPSPEPDVVFPMYKEIEPPKKSNLYFVQALSEQDCNTKKLRGFSNVRLLFQHLNACFFDYTTTPDKTSTPLPRFYIAKNRTLLNEAGTDPNGALAVLFNVKIKPFTKDLYRLTATVVLCEPMGTTHGFDGSSMDQSDDYEFSPKAWSKLRIINVVENANTVINADMDRSFFKKVYNMYKLSNKVPGDLKKIGEQKIANEFVHSILNPVSSNNVNMSTVNTSTVPKTSPSPARIRITPPALEKNEDRSRPMIRLVLKKPEKTSDTENTPEIIPEITPDTEITPEIIPEITPDTEKISDAEEIPSYNLVKIEPETSFDRFLREKSTEHYYTDTSKELWEKLRTFATEKKVPVVNIANYRDKISSYPNAEGFFKYVYFLREDKQKVLQTFRKMTMTQRTTEIASLLALKGLPHMGQITEVIEESHGEIVGLSMQRYQKTLKQYAHAHSHHRLTAYQKMDLIIQMLTCIETIHRIGLAHRDLSEVNFMVNETDEKLRDGSPRAELFLIDFGKSKFTQPKDVRHWWIEQATEITEDYEGEIVPQTRTDLDLWCQQLPWIRSKPDHGYRLYRSIQTLPKNRTDTEDLPWLVNPLSEDIYSLGTIIWKTFSETEPWYGILDTDLKGLRETVGEDYHIERALDREVPGKLSKELLLFFLKVSPEHRKSATEILQWLNNLEIQDGLIAEWEAHAPVGRQKRHAKALFRYDDEQAATTDLGPQKKKQKSNSTTNKQHIPPIQLHIPARSLSPTTSQHKNTSLRKIAPRFD